MDEKTRRILIVDDQPNNLRFLSKILTEQGYQVKRAICGTLAINAAFASIPDLILLDIMMPDISGYEVCKILKSAEQTANIPIIFLSVLDDTQEKVKAFKYGAVDYITKPFQIEEILARIENQLTIQYLQNKLKEQNQNLAKEIEIRKQTEARLEYLLDYNPSVIYVIKSSVPYMVTFISENVKLMVGYTSEDFINKPNFWLDHIHPEDQQKVLGKIRKLQGRNESAISYRFLHKNGNYCWIYDNFKLSVDEEGNPQEILGSWIDITEQKEIESALIESQRWQEAITEATPNILYVFDLFEWQNVYSNLEIYKVLGYTPEEIKAMGSDFFSNLVHPDDMPLLQVNQQKISLAENDQIVESEYRMRHKNGEWKWLFSRDIVFKRSLEGKVHQILGAATDITERKIAEQKLADSQQRLKFLVQQTPLGVIECDLNYEIIDWNDAAEIIFGYDKNAVLGKNIINLLVSEKYKKQVEKIADDLYSQKGGTRSINQNIAKDGGVIICEWYNTALIDDQGKVIGIASMVIDITERIEAEHSLIESAERSRSIVKIIERMRRTLDMETIFAATTEELRLTLNSDRAAIYRFDTDWGGKFMAESVGEEWVKLVLVKNDIEILKDTYLQQIKSGIFVEGNPYIAVNNIHKSSLTESHIKQLDKLQAKAFLIVPIFCGDAQWGLLAIYQNYAPRKWQEEEINIARQIGNQLSVALQQVELLKQTQNQALELIKAKEIAEAANGAKSEFLARMSHELRTPLNAILGFTQIMNRSDDVLPQHQEFLSIINRSGEHLLELINDILSMAKIESGQVQLKENSFDLYALLQAIEELLELKAQSKGLILTFIWDENVPQYIKTDENKLRQVLINLLGNAIKFTPTNGTVSLSVKVGELNVVVTSELIESLIFAVEDTGPGIANHEISNLFNPFVQTQTGRQSLQGSGLGLAISKQFINLMGGNINVSSELHKGSIFTFNIKVKTLPNFKEIKSNYNQITGLKLGLFRPRVLLVEDLLENRQLLVNILGPLGFELKEAKNGQEAFANWLIWQPHLILMDIEMPVMNGYEATKKIKKFSADVITPPPHNTVIIVITASALDDQREYILTSGCDDYISKPIHTDILLYKIGQHLGLGYIY